MQNIYKRYKLAILLSIVTSSLWAQAPNYELSAPETDAQKNYIARDYIKLNSGFHFSATDANHSFSAKIDAGLLFPPTDKTYAVKAPDGTISYNSTNGAVVGSIPGSASVSPTGAATYQIPIDVPSGVNGMQPQVAITYTSQGGFGALGMGWDISGSSAITRGGKSIYYDNQNNNVKIDNSDALYWAGQRLILLSGTPFVDAEYGTEVENYARVKYNGTGFVVTTKDGKTMEYGTSSTSVMKNTNDYYDSRVLAWKLYKVTDTYGNYMTFSYSDFGQYLTQIDYAGQSVIFTYTDNTVNPKSGYINTFLTSQAKILSTITTNSKTYGFVYTTDNRLTTVNETAPDNSKVNATTINWGADNNTIQQVNLGYNPDYNLGQNKGSVYSADVNGDGYPDRIELWGGDSHYCNNNSQDSYGGNKGHVIIYLFDPTTKQFNSTGAGYFFCADDNLTPRLTTGDIDNDGKDEIILYKKDWLVTLGLSGNTLNEKYAGINFNLNDIHQGYNKDRKYQIFTTNINNDNYPDVVMVFAYMPFGLFNMSDLRAGYTVFKGSANGLSKIYDVSYNNDNAFEDFKIGDFNADGKIDVIGKVAHSLLDFGTSTNYDNNYIDFYTDKYSFNPSFFPDPTIGNYTVDFNGDGIPETLKQFSGNTGPDSYLWTFGSYTINGINPANSEGHPAETYQMYPIDYNGDGLVDLIQGDEVTLYDNSIVTNWHFYKNTGNLNFQWENTIQTNCRLNNQTVFVADVNGDGIADLVFPKTTVNTTKETICPDGGDGGGGIQPLASNTNISQPTVNVTTPPGGGGGGGGGGCYDVYSSNTTYEYYAFTIQNANRRNIVTGITNGMGQANSFTYKNFSAYDQTPTTGVVRNLKAPIPVVETQTEPDSKVTTYTFEKPKVHTEGKGFLGFSTVTAVNPTKNIKVVSEYEVEPTYFGVNLKNQSITNTLTPVGAISSSSQINAVIDNSAIVTYGANGKKRYIPIVTQQTSIDELKETKQVTTIDYSLYPTISQTATAGYRDNSTIDLTTKVVSTFTGPNGCLMPYLPATITTTRTQGELSDTRITSYAYEYYTTVTTDPKKYQITKSTETTNSGSTDFAVSTEYSNPDIWGHMQTVTVKAKDQNGAYQSRSSSVSYFPVGNNNPTGRFVASKTNNALNEKTIYNWDETHGLLNSETTVVGAINGSGGTSRTTSYTYNSWGQLVETKFPDGIRKTNVVQWNSDNTARYYTYSETSGQAPVWVYYDALGREVRKETKGLNGNIVRVFTTYTTDGKVDKVSEPTFNSTFNADTDNHTTYGYDPDYGFVSSVTTPVGTTFSDYNKLTTTVTSPEGKSVTVTNAAGQTKSSTVNDKKVTYTYYPSGLTKTSTPQDGQAITMVYNLQGKRTNLVDPDGGTVESKYDGFGELIEEKQIVHANKQQVKTTNHYFGNGLIDNIVRENIENFDTQTPTILNSETTTYTYDPDIKDRVNVIELKDKTAKVLNRQTFTYDPTKITDRVTNVKEEIADNSGSLRTYNTGKVYDALGRVKKEIYPSGYYTVNTYDSYSNLTEIRDEVGSGHSIWKADAENALGQATSIYKGAKQTTYSYDPVNHQTTGIQAAGIIDYTYGYYVADGTNHANNLKWRSDNLTTGNRTVQREDFIYDPQNRLTHWDVTRGGQTTPNSMSFDDNGNIISKTDLGAFTLYYGGKNPNGSTTGRPDPPINSAIGPHALSSISGVPSSFPQVEQPNYPTAELSVTYTDFKKIQTLTEKNKYYELTYGVDDQRRMSVYKVGGVTKLTRYYVGNYEEEVLPNGNVRKIHYLSGAVLIQTTGVADSLYYSYSDAQGSLIALVHDGGNVIQRFAYDPWGARRNPNDWTQKDSRTSFIINRGYTGHEHLDVFGIINMNGRVYDPLTAQFFSPDPYVQAPGDWLNYNRYGYCMGNPFKYTDPSGKFWHLIIGAFIGGVVNWVSHGCEFSWKGLGYFGVGALAGALGAGIGAGISSALPVMGSTSGGFAAGFWGASAATTATTSFVSGALIGGGAGLSSGFISGFGNGLLQNQNFGQALWSGVQAGLVSGFSGALIGGIWGGFKATSDGREFLDGAKEIDEETLVDLKLPKVQQQGGYNCGPASAESNTGVPQQEYRQAVGGNPDADGVNPIKLDNAITNKTGSSVTYSEGSLPENNFEAKGIAESMYRNHRYGVVTSSSETSVDHMMSLNSIKVKTFQTVTNATYKKLIYQVMDPANGVYRVIEANSVKMIQHIFPTSWIAL